MRQIITFGEALIDFHSDGGNPERFAKFAGGAPANVAVAVARLGGRAGFAGALSEDMFGVFLQHTLEELGVDTAYTVRDAAPTALAFVSLDAYGERSFAFYRTGTADLQFRPEHFQDAWFAEPGIFHCCSNTLTQADIRETTLAGMAKAKAAGWLISFDVNLRPNLWPAGSDLVAPVNACLAQADLIKLSLEELDVLRGADAADVWQEQRLADGATLIVVTDGREPISYCSHEGQGTLPVPPVRAVDTTAAGDAFVGGLLYALAERDIAAVELAALTADPAQLSAVLRFAAACGAHTVTRQGSFVALPTRADVDAMLAQFPA